MMQRNANVYGHANGGRSPPRRKFIEDNALYVENIRYIILMKSSSLINEKGGKYE